MTTFADLTPEERNQYRGTWVAYSTLLGEHIAIYESGTTLFEPGYGRFKRPLDTITPRDDLPRAWNPDGTPLAGKWHDDYTDAEGSTLTTGEHLDANPHQHVRRWIGTWEGM